VALSEAYMTSTKNLADILGAIRGGQAPERFSQKFLEELGFKGKNDRAIIRVLKSIGFLDDSGAPTQLYFDYLDTSRSGAVMASAIRDAYSDLFRVNRNAHEMSSTELKNKMKTITQGKKSDSVLNVMAATFRALASTADFSAVQADPLEPEETVGEEQASPASSDRLDGRVARQPPSGLGLSMRYDIHIHLPISRDQQVYDALFSSLRKHLV